MKPFEEIINPYQKHLDQVNYKSIAKHKDSTFPDLFLFMRWAYRVEKGWYGFALGNVPMLWARVIDDFLEELEKDAPHFKIHQVKLKFGGLRFYVDVNVEDAAKLNSLQEEIQKLEKALYHDDLIY